MIRFHRSLKITFILLFTFFCISGFGQEEEEFQDTLKIYEMPEILILGKRDGMFHKIPGSVAYIGKTRLAQIAPVSGNEVLRKIPGIHVVDEEGTGLRLNLSVRGLDPDRSRGLLVLEDGIPVALNPYGEPEMYYTPAIERMSGIELIKGSGQILFGPQTIGGVLNFITADPPETPTGQVRLNGGKGEAFTGLFSYGSSFGNAGFQAGYLHKQADAVGYAGYNIHDLSSKIKLIVNEKSRIGLKIGVYNETSDATYLGLTQTMYDKGGQDFVKMAPDDRLGVKRYSASLIHDYIFTEKLKLKTSVFGYTTTRNWQRQDFSENPNAANRTGVVWGDTTVAGGAIYMLNSTGNRNRQFEVGGVESRLNHIFSLFGFNNELDFGGRALLERAYEQRINGKRKDASSGDMVEDEVRDGRAFSLFVQNRFQVTEKLSFSAGIRFEQYNYERNILRGKFAGVVTDTNIVAASHVNEIIPGIGFNYQLKPGMTIFGGIHKGFAPPRVKDAITTAGRALQLDAESSWNAELGVRKKLNKIIGFEVTGFYMDFSNQIIPVSESSGGAGTGLVNGGSTLHTGVESGVNLDFSSLFSSDISLGWDINGTVLSSTFDADRFIKRNEETVNISGNVTPYAPQVLLNSTLNLETRSGWGITIHGSYAGKQYSDELNTEEPSPNGRTGKIPAWWLVDVNTYLVIPGTSIKVNASVKNLTDNRYLVTRRPQGIRLGLPRYISAGVEMAF